MNISKSKNHNPNYLAKIIQVKGLRKHANADRLQVLSVDFQDVITGLDTKEGDICVFFPLESKIMSTFLSHTNSFRDKELNADQTQTGFFEKTGRVRAVRLRGEKSMGYLVPIVTLENWCGAKLSSVIGEEFDTIGDILIVEKYVVPTRSVPHVRQGKKPRISRLVEGQVHLHVDTENLRRNAFKINPEDDISITYKLHGTSFWVANVLCKRKLGVLEKTLRFLGVKIQETEYDHVYGSRKVVKNQYETQNTQDFYDSDLWGTLKDEFKDLVPKGYTFYGECVGYTARGRLIQAKYDYGCKQYEHKTYIYRITFTNPDGLVVELSTSDTQQMAERGGFNYVPHFYSGKAKDLFPELKIDIENNTIWHHKFMILLADKYNEKNCFICRNIVPEEGIVLRKEKLFEFESYKLKSFAFLEYETAQLDAGAEDIESQN